MAAVAVIGTLIALALQSQAQAAPQSNQPTSSAQAQREITRLNTQAEIVTEQYNAAGVKVRQNQRTAARAKAAAGGVERQFRSLQGKVRTVAITAYQGGHLSSFASFVTSKSPQDFLDQLSAINAISTKQGAVLAQLVKTRTAAQQAETRAAQALAAATSSAHKLELKKNAIARQVGTLKTLLGQLSAQERADLFAQNGSTDLASFKQQKLSSTPPKLTGTKASPKAVIAVKTAEAQLGKPYVWAAVGPNTFDCSGLTLYSWAAAGVTLPRNSAAQYTVGTHVSESELRPGDLVFYYSPIHHVAMYVGNGMVINAPQTGDVVKYAPVNSWQYAGATRVG
jgi:cell wall-associated NlpC family hydrolase